ncbi:hypothetical protein [Aliiroseovarius crassostreae]|uniref:hypothetical protein n=1 Tax=Aliiroseovarius crassostreae TaxID=154981 RepID=UPI003C7E4A9B
MATHATNIELPRTGLRAAFARWGTAFLQAMENHANRTHYARTIRVLNAKSDAELAKMGLTRDDIPRHAFGSMYHI